MDAAPDSWYETPVEILVRSLGVTRTERPAGFTTGWRTLPWITIQAVFRGQYRIEHGAGGDLLSAGSMWFVPPGCRHRHAVVGAAADTGWWQGEVLLHGAVDACAGCGAVQVFPGALDGALGKALQAVLTTAPPADPLSGLERQACATALVVELFRRIARPPAAAGMGSLAPVFRFIDAHLHRPLTRGELAEQAGLAPSRFHERFLAATGVAPMAWVRRRRLARAAELLTGTDLGMADIAARVGLCDAFHLNKRFRAAYGLPPTRFRSQARG